MGELPVRERSAEASTGARRRPRRRRVAVALTALSALAGAALLAIGLTAGAGRAVGRVAGGNVPIDGGAGDPLDLRARNSPVIVANPHDAANLVAANRVDAPRLGCELRYSRDGGATWADAAFPVPAGKDVGCFSPDLAFGPDGALYALSTSFGPVAGQGSAPDGVWLAVSTDGGATFGAPRSVAGPMPFGARIAADPKRPGRLYAAWLAATETTPYGIVAGSARVVAARSDDGGETWGSAVAVSPPARQRAIAPTIAVGADGEVLAGYLDLGDDRLDFEGAHEGHGGPPYAGTWTLVTARSTDAGATWTESVARTGVVPTNRFVALFAPVPSLVLDHAGGGAYVAVQDGRDGDADVWLVRSSDGGRTWPAAVRVNDTRPADGTDQYLPVVAVAPGGRVDVAYYDRRADGQNARDEVSLQSSFDGGRTFTPRLVLTDRSFDSTIGPGDDLGLPELGSRLGLVSTRSATLAAWADTRAGDRVSRKQDLSRALVRFARQSHEPRRAVFLVVGALLLALSSAALLVTRAHRPTVAIESSDGQRDGGQRMDSPG